MIPPTRPERALTLSSLVVSVVSDAPRLQTIESSFEEPTLTHDGGLVLFQQFCRKLDLKRLCQRDIPWQRRERTYPGAARLLCLLDSLVAGLKRISDTRILADNRSFQRLLGLTRFPADTTLRQCLRRVSPEELRGLLTVHDRLRTRLRAVGGVQTSAIWDFDSTVLPLYGWTTQGARVGYNLKKPRWPSYHPLVCFESHTRYDPGRVAPWRYASAQCRQALR